MLHLFFHIVRTKIRWTIRPFRTFVLAALLISFFHLTGTHSLAEGDAERILILHAYHEGFQWTDDISRGITEELKKTGRNLVIHVERLDWKRFPSEDVLNRQLDLYKTKYQDMPPNLVITSDDAALKFAVDHQVELFPDVPIVFCGVLKQVTDKMLAGVSNVTGIHEAVDPQGTIDLILRMQPGVRSVYLFHDGTESGKSTRDSFQAVLNTKAPGVSVTDFGIESQNTIRDALSQASVDSVAVIVSLYAKIDGNVVEPVDFAHFVSSMGLPTYSLYEYSLGGGIVGGSLLGGYSHGQAVGLIAARLLDGEPVRQIPVSNALTVTTKMDDRVIRSLHLARSAVPENVLLINEPFNFFETYRILVFSTLSVFTVLLFLLGLLARSNHARRMAEIALTANHKELTQTYEELAATHDELTSIHEELIASQDDLKQQNLFLEDEQSKNHRLAHYDPLTGLPNRLKLKEAAEAAIAHADGLGRKLVLFFIDTDNFKLINDSFGHIIGDLLLIDIGRRILDVTSETGLAARLGGDEFIVMQELGTEDDPHQYARKIMSVLEAPFTITENKFFMTVSIGVVIYPEHGRTFNDLLKNADTSMYHAKDAGKGRYTVFDNEMNELIVARTNLQRMMRDSLERDEFTLHYQPKVDAVTGDVVGFEALCRWMQPDGSMIPPEKFIPVAEETGLIIPLSNYVMQEACRFMQRLKNSGYDRYPVSVNISVVQISHLQFIDNISDAIASCDLSPKDVILEITESVLMESFDTNIGKLNALRNAGFALSLDDFGTGYSSLTYLKQLPLKELKIDKSFIRDLCSSPEQAGIIRTIVQLAHQLDLHVVAEGVETSEQAACLREIGCHTLQGYHISPPCPEAEAIVFLKNSR